MCRWALLRTYAGLCFISNTKPHVKLYFLSVKRPFKAAHGFLFRRIILIYGPLCFFGCIFKPLITDRAKSASGWERRANCGGDGEEQLESRVGCDKGATLKYTSTIRGCFERLFSVGGLLLRISSNLFSFWGWNLVRHDFFLQSNNLFSHSRVIVHANISFCRAFVTFSAAL